MKIAVIDSYNGKPVEGCENLQSREIAERISDQMNDGRRLDGREDRYYVRAPRVRVRTPTLAEVMRSYTHPNDNLWSQGAAQESEPCIDCDEQGRYPSGTICKSCAGTSRVPKGSNSGVIAY